MHARTNLKNRERQRHEDSWRRAQIQRQLTLSQYKRDAERAQRMAWHRAQRSAAAASPTPAATVASGGAGNNSKGAAAGRGGGAEVSVTIAAPEHVSALLTPPLSAEEEAALRAVSKARDPTTLREVGMAVSVTTLWDAVERYVYPLSIGVSDRSVFALLTSTNTLIVRGL